MINSKKKLTIINILLTIFACIWIFPILLVVVNSFKPLGEIISNIMALPRFLYTDNFAYVLKNLDYWKLLLNTVLVTTGSTVMVIVFAPLCAYKLARVDNLISTIILTTLVSSMIIPFQSIMIPMAKSAKALGLINTIPGLILLQFAINAPFSVFMYHGFIKKIPKELDEAAVIDGCNGFQTYFRVILPSLRPITGSVSVLIALWVWNDFALTNIIMTQKSMKTLTTTIYTFFSTTSLHWDYALAGLVMSALPIVVFYLLMQKFIIQGLMDGSVKG